VSVGTWLVDGDDWDLDGGWAGIVGGGTSNDVGSWSWALVLGVGHGVGNCSLLGDGGWDWALEDRGGSDDGSDTTIGNLTSWERSNLWNADGGGLREGNGLCWNGVGTWLSNGGNRWGWDWLLDGSNGS
jgi:hypothetical protein